MTAARKPLDAIEMLMQDHREVESLFRQFEYLQAKDADAGHVVDAACAELRTHDQLNSELFCPALSEAVDGPGTEALLSQFAAGQQAIRELIERVEQADSDRTARDAQFSLLSASVERHFELAETQVFPRARELERLDLVSVAELMKACRDGLTQAV